MLALRVVIEEEDPGKQSDNRRKDKSAIFSNLSEENVSGRREW